MKRTKRMLALAFGMLLLLGTLVFFTGCGSKIPTITLIGPDWSNSSNAEEAEKVINARLKELGLNFQLKILWDDGSGATAKLALDTADKNVDIVMINSWTQAKYSLYAQQGALLRLDDPEKKWLENYGADMRRELPGFLWDGWKLNGANGYGIYGAPGYKDYAMIDNWDINNTLLSELGFNYNDIKWDYKVIFDPQFEAALAAAKEKYPQMYPMIIEPDKLLRFLTSTEWDSISEGLLWFGYDPDNPALPEEPMTMLIYDVDAAKDVIAKFEEFYQKGYVDPRLALREQTVDTRAGLLAAGNYLFASLAGGGDAAAAMFSAERGIEVKMPMITTPYAGPIAVQGSGFAVSIYSQNYKEAVQFLNALNTDAKIATTMAYGAEGIHWVRNNDGTITRTELGFQEYMPWDRGMASNYMDLVPALDTLGVTFKQDFKAEQAQAVPTAIIGFVFNQDPVVSEIAALATVYAEYNFRVSTGAGNPAIMEEYRQKLFANGMQRLIDEVNSQLREYYRVKKQ